MSGVVPVYDFDSDDDLLRSHILSKDHASVKEWYLENAKDAHRITYLSYPGKNNIYQLASQSGPQLLKAVENGLAFALRSAIRFPSAFTKKRHHFTHKGFQNILKNKFPTLLVHLLFSQDRFGRNAFHCAVESAIKYKDPYHLDHLIDVYHKLPFKLQIGKLNIQDSNGDTVLHYAARGFFEQPKVLEHLRDLDVDDKIINAQGETADIIIINESEKRLEKLRQELEDAFETPAISDPPFRIVITPPSLALEPDASSIVPKKAIHP